MSNKGLQPKIQSNVQKKDKEGRPSTPNLTGQISSPITDLGARYNPVRQAFTKTFFFFLNLNFRLF
jgi:hypothetical protein